MPYIHFPHLLLNSLVAEERVKVDPRMHTLVAGEAMAVDVLSSDEKKVLDWVATTYGKMGASEISEHSHREMAYKSRNQTHLSLTHTASSLSICRRKIFWINRL